MSGDFFSYISNTLALLNGYYCVVPNQSLCFFMLKILCIWVHATLSFVIKYYVKVQSEYALKLRVIPYSNWKIRFVKNRRGDSNDQLIYLVWSCHFENTALVCELLSGGFHDHLETSSYSEEISQNLEHIIKFSTSEMMSS